MTVDIVFCLNRGALRPMLAAMNSIATNAAAPGALRFSIAVPEDPEERAVIGDAVAKAFPEAAFAWRIGSLPPPDHVAAYIRGRQGKSMTEAEFRKRSMQYSRLWISSVFPDMGKFIYFDCDVIVIDDVAKLWAEARLTDERFFAAAPHLFTGLLYFRNPLKGLRESLGMLRPFNSGMIVTDARLWDARVETRLRRILDWDAENDFRLFSLHDEPILNLLFKDYMRLPARWNRCGFGNSPRVARLLERPIADISVIHWSGGHCKPWVRGDIPYADYWHAYDMVPVAA